MDTTCSKNNDASNPVMTDHAYSHAIKHARVLLLGPYPPPWGGIAVHIQRVQHTLQMQDNVVIVFDTITRTSFVRYVLQLIYVLWKDDFDYLIYHTPYTDYSWIEMVMLYFYATIKSAFFMLIEHDCRYIARSSWFKKRIIAWFCAQAHMTIFMGVLTYESYKKAGINVARYRIESPFLPPNLSQSFKPYPSTLTDFITSHYPLLVANAYQCALFEGADLYGIDQSIALSTQLQRQFPNLGMVFFLATIGNHDYYQQVVSQLNRHTYFLVGDYQLCPIFKHVDCFIRPTRNENFGISVAEALYCKVPVVASNVCIRPSGTILYQSNDVADLVIKTTHVLENIKRKRL